MRVLVAPDKFKGSLTAAEAARAIARGVRAAGAEAIELPVADGGEGTLDALVHGAGGTVMGVIARGPMGVPVRAHLGRLADGTGVVEMAQASGLRLVPERERDPLRATSRGTGELIRGALARMPPAIIVALGGSATVDGGTGLAAALGVRFLGEDGRPVADGGGALERLAKIDASRLDERLGSVRLVAAADVASPLLGPRGAARAFGPQKGATPSDVEALEHGLGLLAERLKIDLRADVAGLPGAGAAGGAGAMLAALGAEIRPGIDVVLETLRFDQRVAAADLVLTGEGRLDETSLAGKAPVGVARVARTAGVGCVALAGEALVEGEFDEVRSLMDHFGGDREQAMRRAAEGLAALARAVVAERVKAR
jgi:glycerate kinase